MYGEQKRGFFAQVSPEPGQNTQILLCVIPKFSLSLVAKKLKILIKFGG